MQWTVAKIDPSRPDADSVGGPSPRRPWRLDVAVATDLSPTELDIIYHHVTRDGCIIVHETHQIDPLDSLAAIGRLFGPPIPHNMSDARGIHPVHQIPGHDDYANTTNADLSLHTDGSFEHRTPKFQLLHCQSPATEGGQTRLAFAENVYAWLRDQHPDAFDGLFRPDAFAVTRGDRQAANAVFRSEGDVLSMTFRAGADIALAIHPEAEEGFRMIEQHLSDEANYLELRLEAQQTLILDNTRVLHGRSAFVGDASRRLYGLWLDVDPALSGLFTLGFGRGIRSAP